MMHLALGTSPWWTLLAVLIGGLISVFGQLVAGWLADRRALRAERIEALSGFLIAIRMFQSSGAYATSSMTAKTMITRATKRALDLGGSNQDSVITESAAQRAALEANTERSVRSLIESEAGMVSSLGRLQMLFPKTVVDAANALLESVADVAEREALGNKPSAEEKEQDRQRYDRLVESLFAEARSCVRGLLGKASDRYLEWCSEAP